MNKLKRKRLLAKRIKAYSYDTNLTHPYLDKFGFKHWVACEYEKHPAFVYFTQHKLEWRAETSEPPPEVFAAYAALKLLGESP